MTKQLVRLNLFRNQLLASKSYKILESRPTVIERDCDYCLGSNKDNCCMCDNTGKMRYRIDFPDESYTPIYHNSKAKFDYRLDDEEIICECGKRVYGRLCDCGAIYEVDVILKVDTTKVNNNEFWKQQAEEYIKKRIEYIESEIAKMEAEE